MDAQNRAKANMSVLYICYSLGLSRHSCQPVILQHGLLYYLNENGLTFFTYIFFKIKKTGAWLPNYVDKIVNFKKIRITPHVKFGAENTEKRENLAQTYLSAQSAEDLLAQTYFSALPIFK